MPCTALVLKCPLATSYRRTTWSERAEPVCDDPPDAGLDGLRGASIPILPPAWRPVPREHEELPSKEGAVPGGGEAGWQGTARGRLACAATSRLPVVKAIRAAPTRRVRAG